MLEAAAGAHTKGKPVVEWDADGQRMAGTAVRSYDRVRKLAGAHLAWMVQRFCACQMLMLDPIHQIDHGVIVYLQGRERASDERCSRHADKSFEENADRICSAC